MMTDIIENRFRGEEEGGGGEMDMRNNLVKRFNHANNLLMPGTIAPLYAQEDAIELKTLEKMTGVEKLRRRQARKSRYKLIQIKIFNLLERPSGGALLYHGLVFVLILASLFLSVLITIPKYEKDSGINDGVYYMEVSLVIIFSVEYVLRIWSCSCHGNYAGFWGKLRFIKKPYQVIDIIVIVATTVVVAQSKEGESSLLSVSMFRFLRFLQVLRILRLDRQRGAFKIVSHVIYEHRQELLTCWYMSFILLVACTFLVYLAEKGNDREGQEAESGELDNLGDGLYWGVITLSTVGYGDFSPKNWVAKLIVCFFAFIGTAFFALPAGILGSGFALQVAQNQKQKHFNRRRVPAALVIQYAWRMYAAHPSRHSEATWMPHQQVINPPKEKKYSVYTKTNPASPSQTPTAGRKSMAFLRRKLNPASRIHSQYIDDTIQSRRSSIGATIPTALELRDRCQSEGNLLLVSPNNVEDHQATIVSLPPQHFEDGFFDRQHDTFNERMFAPHLPQFYRNSVPEIQLQPLMEKEKNCIRFFRKIKLFIYIRKFKEECRPYDVKDVLEQYSSGQADLFSFFKKFQQNVEGFLGIKVENNYPMEKSLIYRVAKMEQKVSSMDEKLDTILRMLENRTSFNHCHHGGGGGHDGSNAQDALSQGLGSIDIDIPMGDSNLSSMIASRDEYVDASQVDRERKRGQTFESAELTRRLEQLKGQEGEGRRRTESRFTVTPSVLIPDPFLTQVDIVDGESENKPESQTLSKAENVSHSIPDVSTAKTENKVKSAKLTPSASPDVNLLRHKSFPNLVQDKHVERPEDIRRSSSVHFDESSIIKHKHQLATASDEKKDNRTSACRNPYISDVDSDTSSSKTPSPSTSTTSLNVSPRQSNNVKHTMTNGHVKHDGKQSLTVPSSNSRTSILKRHSLEHNHSNNTRDTGDNPIHSSGSDSVLTTVPNVQHDPLNANMSKSAFELSC